MIRYNVAPGALEAADDGQFVEYAVAKRDIERLGNELFSARAQLVSLEKQRQADIARKDELIAQLHEQKRQAVMSLGYDDPDANIC